MTTEHYADVRTVELVRRASEEIAADFLDVHEFVRRIMHRIHEHQRARTMSETRRPRDIVDRAERVRRCTHRYELRLSIERSLEIIPVELASFRNHLHRANSQVTVARKLTTWINVRMMIELGDYYLITL